MGAPAEQGVRIGLSAVVIALRDRKRREPVVNQLETSLGVNAFVAIVTVGILFAWVHRAPVNASLVWFSIWVLGARKAQRFMGASSACRALDVSIALAMWGMALWMSWDLW